ncbi:MAG: UDP-N-acetylmuramoyl-L-alanyl-D-glutamate--2,6-diaminopimelate ligase, partial [Bacteroidales bacterium]|nr:UDP-N-acetylmuramoyl-L-alanyl-D-glutamate--2,6-diaminopimelate ligase [Bacteroidales bacterium]
GCVGVIAEGRDAGTALAGLDTDAPLATVDGLDRQLSAIAGRFYGNPGAALRLTAITGTNGKTSCSYLLGQLLEMLGERAGIVGTLGYGLMGHGLTNSGAPLVATGMTTPDAVETQRILAAFVEQGATVATLEVSSHSLDQYRVAALPFDTAVFTNLSRDHLDYHGTLDAYGAAKARLFAWRGLRHAVINRDDAFGRQLLAGLPAGVAALDYSLCEAAAVRASDIVYSQRGVSARLDTPWGRGMLSSPLLGEFNLSNLLAVVAAACAQGHSLDRVLALIPALKPVSGRMEIVSGPAAGRPQVVVDYAHTPDALEKALLALRRHCAGRLWCLFGCGGDRDTGKRPLMGAVAARLADQVVVTSDNPRSEQPDAIIADILAGMPGVDAVVEADRHTAILNTVLAAGPGDTVLIAGKGHEDYQQVGGDRLPFSDQAEARLALQRRGGARQ